MSHDIEESQDGRATFVAVKDHGWHQKGTLVNHEITVAEGLRLSHLAGLDYHLAPIAAIITPADLPVVVHGGDIRAAVRRDPFNPDEWQVLGAGMMDGFTMHTPEQAFGFGQDIIDSGTPLAAMGSIAGGRKAFAAFHADDITIGGVDQVRMYLNVMTGFVGNMATTVRVSAIRVECSNTFHAVLGEASAPTYKVRHVGEGLEGRIEDARTALNMGYRGMEQFQREVEALMDREVTDEKFRQMVEAFVPINDDAPQVTITRARDSRDGIARVYDSPTVANIRGTAWGALNAMTEWLDWTGGNFQSAENRLVAQITPGSAIDVKRLRAGQVVAKAVGLNPKTLLSV
jgi:phage/plasmid-like protein (TIGR03299 family)